MENFLNFVDPWLSQAIEVVFLAVTPLIVALLAKVLDDQKRQWVSAAAKGAFEAVEAVAKKTQMKSDDKAAEALKLVAEELGKPSLSKKEADVAKRTFDRLSSKAKLTVD